MIKMVGTNQLDPCKKCAGFRFYLADRSCVNCARIEEMKEAQKLIKEQEIEEDEEEISDPKKPSKFMRREMQFYEGVCYECSGFQNKDCPASCKRRDQLVAI